MLKKRKSSLAKRKKARKNYEKVAKTSKPGNGKRFDAVKKSIKANGASDPEAVAAAIGRKKYGAKKFAKMAAVGRKKKGKR